MAAAVANSLPTLLSTLTESLSSATSSLPDTSATIPPTDGLSLLSIKNELLLSYLQNLVFLIVLKLRDLQSDGNNDSTQTGGEQIDHTTQDAVIKKLVELRDYLERGVRPLEGRLKYQIDKVLRAAEYAARISTTAAAQKDKAGKKTAVNGSRDHGTGNEDGVSDSGDSSSEEDEDEERTSDGDANADADVEINELSYRPNPSAMKLSSTTPQPTTTSPRPSTTTKQRGSDGIYRPPKITPTALPTTTTSRPSRETRRPHKSATMDEFISTELSSAPMPEPSIGSTIQSRGRNSYKSARERETDEQRRTYEESNFVRLPGESKKERAKKAGAGGMRRQEYGGEEWRGLGEGAERIDALTRKRDRGASGVLQRSRKRGVEDGLRGGDGVRIGEAFEKRRRLWRMGGGRGRG